MEKLAIIGTGIAGMGCAHYLRDHFDISVFEKNDYPGGHTHTVYVDEADQKIPIDSGFIVFNYENYPLLTKLFTELNVPIKPTSMSFSSQVIHDRIEYCGSSLQLLFAQKKNLFSPRYFRFLVQLNQFNRVCLEVLEKKELQVLSVRAYIKRRGWNDDLLNWYLLPMSSALWSTPPETSARFPILALVRFFKNHGFLGLNTQFQWYTVTGGSDNYKYRLLEPLKDRVKLQLKVKSVRKNENHVVVLFENGEEESFDRVIIATHADQALELLVEPGIQEKETLGLFAYETNKVTLHTDSTVMPKNKQAWSSWNYRTEKKNNRLFASCHYWMNSLQGVSDRFNYFISINEPGIVDASKIIRQFEYEHPVFTVDAMLGQERLPALNQNGRVYFCGSYFGYGFHEDALRSAIDVCNLLLPKSQGKAEVSDRQT